ncbi:MAG: type II toxin-antitoxin system HicB family antitoxin [Candidatus Atribacteria bacterium]|nr:type II toxin-antitoxin system HicB family antitoxin [Candidatus Atribacteria bacterium]
MEISYVVWQEGKYYVSQCLNFEISSFGETLEEAINKLKEAAELYLEGENIDITEINKIIVGKERVNV